MNYENKIGFIVLLMAIFVPLIIFNGAIDDFAPKHMVIISEIVQKGHVEEGEQAPGFYTFGAISNIFTGLPTKNFLYLPIQLIPYLIIFFTLMYKLSGNYLVSSLITFIELIAGSTGTGKIYFWPHGMGFILFYTLILIFLWVVEVKNFKKLRYRILLILLGTSLVYMSYDLIAMALIISAIISLICYGLWVWLKDTYELISEDYRLNAKSFSLLFLILTVVQFGFSSFVYKHVIPLFGIHPEISGIDKFIFSYINTELIQMELQDIYISYPKIISIISSIKYSLLLITIILFLLILIRKIINRDYINPRDAITSSIILMAIIYSLMRLYIGGIAITAIYLPGIFCIMILYRSSNRLKTWATFVILLLLILTPMYYYEKDSHNLINKDTNYFNSIEYPAHWYLNNRYTPSFAVSDELTKNFFVMYGYEKNVLAGTHPRTVKSVKILRTDDALFLINRANDTVLNKYFIINYNLNSMSLQNWKIIKSWNYLKDDIDKNHGLNKIYYADEVAIYHTS